MCYLEIPFSLAKYLEEKFKETILHAQRSHDIEIMTK